MTSERRRDQEYSDPITIAEALAADDKLFHRLVNADMRDQCHPTVSAVLRSPQLVNRWIYELNNIKRRIESQLARHRASIQGMLNDPKAVTEFVQAKATWKMAAISMRSGAEGRLAEAHALADRYRNDLIGLIREHRQYVLSHPDDTEEADAKLWAVLDES